MGSDRVSGPSSLPTHPNRVILRVSDWEARGWRASKSSNRKDWILDGVCGKAELEGRPQGRRRKEGRTATQSTGMRAGSQNSWAGFLASPHIRTLWDDSGILKRITRLERTLLLIYLI